MEESNGNANNNNNKHNMAKHDDYHAIECGGRHNILCTNNAVIAVRLANCDYAIVAHIRTGMERNM